MGIAATLPELSEWTLYSCEELNIIPFGYLS